MKRQLAWFWLFLFSAALVGLTLFTQERSSVVLADETTEAGTTRKEFEGWDTPDVALFISGQQYGYIEPCGCTGLANQKGGLARRDSLLTALRKQGWNLVALDAGNQVRRIGAQQDLKFQTTIDSLREMKYAAIGLGPDDLHLSFGELIASLVASTDAAGQSDLFVCANANPLGFVPPVRVIREGNLQIGVTCVLGKEALEKVTTTDVQKRDPLDALREALAELRKSKSQYHILLAQAPAEECREWAKAVPGWDMIVCAEGIGEPTFQAEVIAGTKTSMIQTGGKGMYVGVIGLFAGPPARVRYQRIPLDARFTDSKKMLDRLATYQDALRFQGLAGLGLNPVRHAMGQFVGSATCGDCHTKAYAHWLTTPHAKATDSIVNPKERSSIARHFDPECLSCHVTGWNPQGYFPYETGYVGLEESKLLHGNGCENCHGPGKAHAAAEAGDEPIDDAKLQSLRAQMRLPLDTKAHDKCLECHDLDNSPDFHHDGSFEKYWKQIQHPWRD